MEHHFNPGVRIDGRYKVLKELGRGAMGTVVLAKDLTTDEDVALKYCHVIDPEAFRRFAREVRCMSKINHPHVMPVLDANLDYGPPYFTMPIATKSLAEDLGSSRTEQETLQDFKEMCLGTQAIHATGATHRDIKPANAMRVGSRVVISDLGLVKFDERDTTILTQTAQFMGTRIYCAPEQLVKSRDADARTDVYLLGKTLYHLLTGEVPALVDTDKLSPGLAHILRRATREQPSERYQSVGELLDAIESYARAKEPGANPARNLDALIQETENLLKAGKYRGDNLKSVFQMLIALKGYPSDFLEWFDKIPERLLITCADALASEFEPVVHFYSDIVHETIQEHPWSYAETVARKTNIIFTKTHNIEIKRWALRATLSAAVKQNRYAAMQVFDEMLIGITSDVDAAVAAEVLEANYDLYAVVADRVTPSKLHSTILRVQQETIRKTGT